MCQPLKGIAEKYRESIREIRLRNGKPVTFDVGGNKFFVCNGVLCKNSVGALSVTGKEISEVLEKATEGSIFTYEKQLTEGYLTLQDGARIGIGGQLSFSEDGRAYYRSLQSMCIRIAHCIEGASKCLWGQEKCNVLVCGQPASGKTTFIRDYAQYLSQRCNVLVADERGEITLCDGFDKDAIFCDVLLWGSKKFCFETGVRSLSPDVIVCDELSMSDRDSLRYALTCGVYVVASVHASGEEDVRAKLGDDLYGLFDKVVLLTTPDSDAVVLQKQGKCRIV